MKSKNVLIIIPHLAIGGTEIQTLSLANALSICGNKVSVLCLYRHIPEIEDRFRSIGADIMCLSPQYDRYGPQISYHKGWPLFKFLYNGLRKAIKKYSPDIIHVQYMTPATSVILILKLLLHSKIILATAHTSADIYSPLGLKIVRTISKYMVNGFQCITEKAEKSFFGSSRLFTEDSRLNKRYGNHFTIYNNLPSYINIRTTAREFSDNRHLTIGVVSRLEHIKGMDMIVKAFAAINKDFPDTSLLVVGDGSLRGSLESETESLGLSDKVSFAGRQSQEKLQNFYDKIDILLMPSRSEGFGLTAIEGMARGCILVASDTGGLSEVIRDNTDGVLHKPDSLNDMIAKIKYVITHTDKETFSSNAVERASLFSTKTYNNKIKNLYNLI